MATWQHPPDDNPSIAVRIASSAAVVTGAVIAPAFIIDTVWGWLGGTPFATCAVAAAVDTLIGQAIGLVLGAVGFTIWAVSAFRSRLGGAMLAAGVLISLLPVVITHLLGADCLFVP